MITEAAQRFDTLVLIHVTGSTHCALIYSCALDLLAYICIFFHCRCMHVISLYHGEANLVLFY